MKKILLIAAILFLAAMLLIYPEDCLSSAKNGLDIWFSIVVPSLLPFMVASFILLETGIVRLIAHILSPVTRLLFAAPGESAYVFLAAALSGYPVGAKLTAELYTAGQLSEKDAQAVIRFTSVSGPVFLTGAVGAGMLGVPEAGVYLIAAHYLSAVLVGVVFGFFGRRHLPSPVKVSLRDTVRGFRRDIAACAPLGTILSGSVQKAVATLLKIGGFIVFFFVVMEVLSVSGIMDLLIRLYTPAANLIGMSTAETRTLFIGSIEMTAGCTAAASLTTALTARLSLISAIIAFGGLCIHMQTHAVCGKLVPKHFFLAKSLQAMFAYGICTLSLFLMPLSVSADSFSAQSKTAAYTGIVFAAASFIVLLIIKRVQKTQRSCLTLSRKL